MSATINSGYKHYAKLMVDGVDYALGAESINRGHNVAVIKHQELSVRRYDSESPDIDVNTHIYINS